MSTLLFYHKKKLKIFFPLKGIVFPERSSIISSQVLDSKAFIANDMNASVHKYITIEFKSRK